MYELCVKLASKAPYYMLDLWVHDAISLLGESIPVSKVVAHWAKIVHSFNVARMADSVLVFDSYYLDEAAREGLRAKQIRFIGAVNPKRFPVLSSLVMRGVDQRGTWKGLWNGQRKDIIVHSFTKQGKKYIALSNAYTRLATTAATKQVPVCGDYGQFFNACKKAHGQIKNRIWPHRHGGRGKLGERGKFSSFAFGVVLQNTFNAFRDIRGVDSDDYHCIVVNN